MWVRTYWQACAAPDKLAQRCDGSAHDGWTRLQARSHQFGGQLARLMVRPPDDFDAEGNPVPIRRHHPETSRRPRPSRFDVVERLIWKSDAQGDSTGMSLPVRRPRVRERRDGYAVPLADHPGSHASLTSRG
jgi:hypothetical protein